MQIVIVGSGYVGLVTGTCFAEVGIDVICVDIDHAKIENLKKGISPIYEPGLDAMIEKNISKGHLSFSIDLSSCLDNTDVVFSAVGTPPDEDGSADLQYVLDVARTVGKCMNKYILVVTKSTVPVGTAKLVRETIQSELDKRGLDIKFDVASNPEFLKEGSAVEDFLRPDRIVVGVESPRAEEIMKRLYKPFTLNGHPIIFMDVPSAEMTKYAANSMLATRISFMNEIANLCEIVGADINMVRKGIGSDNRIGNKFLYAGIGYGGSCFPKDVKALIMTGEQNDFPLNILKAVEGVNEKQKHLLFHKLMKFYNNKIIGRTVSLWGLSFKPQTDDMRDAPALALIEDILKAGGKVKVYDPVAMKEAHRRIGDKIEYCKDPYDTLIDSEALFLVTEWSEFRFPNWNVIKKLMKSPVVFDGRNIYDGKELKNYGFEYFCIGIDTSLL